MNSLWKNEAIAQRLLDELVVWLGKGLKALRHLFNRKQELGRKW
jgi:hypothetical protein